MVQDRATLTTEGLRTVTVSRSTSITDLNARRALSAIAERLVALILIISIIVIVVIFICFRLITR